MDENFVAVKVGDVNSTSTPNSLISIDERSNGTWNLDVLTETTTNVEAGDEFTVADIALYAYTHTADEGGFDLPAFPAVCRKRASCGRQCQSDCPRRRST